jgi:hypothetical protein
MEEPGSTSGNLAMMTRTFCSPSAFADEATEIGEAATAEAATKMTATNKRYGLMRTL